MIQLDYKVLLWDFDGVILNSMAVRDQGFVEVLKEFPKEQIDALLEFHRKNGGLPRYVKFRFFFEEIRKESITEVEVNKWAAKFSIIMKSLLINPALLIHDALDFIKENYAQIPMHIVSGSDQNELRYLCCELKIDRYFKSIHGSPTPKKQLVEEVLERNNYAKETCILIGDSYNDFEAAVHNNIDFAGYNNQQLKEFGNHYVGNFKKIKE